MMILELLARNVAQRPDHPFLLHEGQRVTYTEFDRLVNRMAHALIGLGVRPGDRVTLGMGNSVEYVVAQFAILRAGAVIHPVNPGLGSAELGFIVAHAEPRVVVTSAEMAPYFSPPKMTLPANCRLAVIGETKGEARGAAGGGVDLGRCIDESPDTPPGLPIDANDPSTLLYTSGTTGKPKGVLFRHHSTGAAGAHFLETLQITGDDVILAVTPLFHGNAWGAVVTAIQAGGTVAFPRSFQKGDFWPLVHRAQATVLYTLGTILAILLTQEETELERDNPLRIIVGLGSANIRQRIIDRFGVEHVAECFGSTDAGVVTIEPLGQAPRVGSCGPPVPGVTIRIADDTGQPLPTRAVGEILIHSPHRMAEYFRNPEDTAAALREGWFHTGDLGYLDEDGWLYFVDRKRDVIRRGGENMSSVLIEKTLREHPSVADCAVIGVPDPVLGQEVKAYIVASAPVTADELREFASHRLAKFQVPRLWEFRDSLPKTPTQRVEKYKLRQEHGTTQPLMG